MLYTHKREKESLFSSHLIRKRTNYAKLIFLIPRIFKIQVYNKLAEFIGNSYKIGVSLCRFSLEKEHR